MKIIGIIPSRLKSKRLPNKPILEIQGLPLIAHVIKRASMSKVLDELFVATDSNEIASIAKANNCRYVMTSASHKTGSDRIAEAVKDLDCDIVVNIQGDEALLNPIDIDNSVSILTNRKELGVSMLVTKFYNLNSYSDVKVAINKKNEIIKFSREDIPYQGSVQKTLLKAYHLVSFRKEALIEFSRLPQTKIEKRESIEYMRLIENNIKIGCKIVNSSAISVDTQDDLEEVRKIMATDDLFKSYSK